MGGGVLGAVALSGTVSAQGKFGNGNGIGAFLNAEALARDSPVWDDGVTNMTGQESVEILVGTTVELDTPDDLPEDVPPLPPEGPFGFDPMAVKISPGTDVVWKWLDFPGNHHSVTSYNGGADDPEDHGQLFDEHGEGGYQFTHTFDEIGNYLYFCIPHGTPYEVPTPLGPKPNVFGMRGAVIVAGNPNS